MKIEIYDKDNIDQYKWGTDKDSQFAHDYLYPMIKNGAGNYIDNVDAEMMILVFDNVIFPLVLGNPKQKVKNSYVCSPKSHYIDYAKEEIKIELKDKPLLRNSSLKIIGLLEYFFNKMDFEKVVYVNNWLLSTNLYTEFDVEKFTEIKAFLIEKFPEHTIIFRSINDMYDKSMLKKLQDLNFGHALSRQVYILDPKKEIYKKKDSYKKDIKVKRKSTYYWEDADKISSEDYTRMRFLYDDLYISKYSPLNPTFNENFIRETMKNNCFTYKVLKKDNIIYAVFGYFERDGFITAPLFGYDTSIDEKDGLYRLTALKILENAIENNWIVHQSSGVSKFKMHRGAESSIEYNMIYHKHVPFKQRIPWMLLEKLTDYAIIPVMKKYQL